LAGFTLLEVLLAVTILGMCITVILQQFSVALRAGSSSQEDTLAVLHAKQKIEDLKTDYELAESSKTGSFDDGYEWETRVTPYYHEAKKEDEQIYENLRVETYQLESVIKWKAGRKTKQISLTTLKTVRKKEWK
jgi:general secretion pathway protein I